MEKLRSSVRPIVTFAFVGALILIVVRLTWNLKVPSLPTEPLPGEVYAGIIASFLTAVAIIIGFWFGARGQSPRS